MEIALRTVAYVIIALISISLLFEFLPILRGTAENFYCSVSSTLFLLSPCKPYYSASIDIESEDSLASMIAYCAAQKDGMCSVVTLKKEIDTERVTKILVDAGVNATVVFENINQKKTVYLQKDGTRVLVR
ncbi:MAG: hypothetical protein QW035_04155 [Candidatus Anstonellales archaeon]